MANGEIKGLPKAKEMLELEWDDALEQEAQRSVIRSSLRSKKGREQK